MFSQEMPASLKMLGLSENLSLPVSLYDRADPNKVSARVHTMA